MITISLNGAEFFAYHGFYPEEQKLGNKFFVDVSVSFEPLKDLHQDKLINTVDYEKLHDIITAQMKVTKKLIETVAQGIADEIKIEYPFAESIRIAIKKINPPLSGKVNYSAIEITI